MCEHQMSIPEFKSMHIPFFFPDQTFVVNEYLIGLLSGYTMIK